MPRSARELPATDCPIHPKKANPALFGYTSGLCPEAERAAREVVNLPTHPKVSEKGARRAVKWLLKNASPVGSEGAL